MGKKASKKPRLKAPTFRTVQEINQEFSTVAMQAGVVQLQIILSEDNLSALNAKLRALDAEGSAANQRAQQEEMEKAARSQPRTEPSNASLEKKNGPNTRLRN